MLFTDWFRYCLADLKFIEKYYQAFIGRIVWRVNPALLPPGYGHLGCGIWLGKLKTLDSHWGRAKHGYTCCLFKQTSAIPEKDSTALRLLNRAGSSVSNVAASGNFGCEV